MQSGPGFQGQPNGLGVEIKPGAHVDRSEDIISLACVFPEGHYDKWQKYVFETGIRTKD